MTIGGVFQVLRKDSNVVVTSFWGGPGESLYGGFVFGLDMICFFTLLSSFLSSRFIFSLQLATGHSIYCFFWTHRTRGPEFDSNESVL